MNYLCEMFRGIYSGPPLFHADKLNEPVPFVIPLAVIVVVVGSFHSFNCFLKLSMTTFVMIFTSSLFSLPSSPVFLTGMAWGIGILTLTCCLPLVTAVALLKL